MDTGHAEWLNRLQIDCATVGINPPAIMGGGPWLQRIGNRYNAYANAGAVLYVLGRNAEALKNLQSAESIFPWDSNLHMNLGELFQVSNLLDQSEQEFRNSIRLRPTDMGWYGLGRLYVAEKRFEDAAQAFRHARD